MFIPLRTDRTPKRRPVITEGLIIVNMLVYLLGLAGNYFGWFSIESFTDGGHFDPRSFTWWQLFTYQFLHDPSGIWHLLFNMLFLWVFGCAVEGRLSRPGFLTFYLMAGAFAGIAHALVDPHPVIGASGSIAGVSGAFLALFPRSRILLASIIGLLQVPALWFIAFYFVLDLLRQTAGWLGAGSDNVAYMAHLAGYIFGFALAVVLLTTKIIKHEEFDVFYLWKQARRRAAFRAASRAAGHGRWDAKVSPEGAAPARVASPAPLSESDQEIAEVRARIGLLLGESRLAEAAAAYGELLADAPDAVFSESRQLDLANQLYTDGRHDLAAIAYENLLSAYPAGSDSDKVRLLLSLIYTRHLPRRDRARELLARVRDSRRLGEMGPLADQLQMELNES